MDLILFQIGKVKTVSDSELAGSSVNCFKTDIFPFKVTYNADDTHFFINGYCSVFLQVIKDFVQMLGVVYRNGYTYF